MHFIGIDIGGASSKVAVMDEQANFASYFCYRAALARSRSRGRLSKI